MMGVVVVVVGGVNTLSHYTHVLFGRATLSQRRLQSFALIAKRAPPPRQRGKWSQRSPLNVAAR